MKKVLIAVMTLLLLAGCKSKISRELDKIEKQVKIASTNDELTRLVRSMDSLQEANNYKLNKEEDAQYHGIFEQIQKKARCAYAQTYQKEIQEDGWMNVTIKLLGNNEDILSISEPTMSSDIARMICGTEDLTALWWGLGFNKVIFSNDLGPVYTWEP